MHSGNRHRTRPARVLLPGLAAWIAGTAGQLAQPALSPAWVYGVLLALAVVVLIGCWLIRETGWRAGAIFALATAMLAFGQLGLRCVVFQSAGLSPALEGRDLVVTGVIATMPQRGPNGLRLQMRVESAHDGAREVQLPPDILLGWYSAFDGGEADTTRMPPTVWAGERWRMVVRLKAPHGNTNPHGFDYELWLWEQGVQATGYVRLNSKYPAPQRLAQTWRHPVAWLRQLTRQRIDARLPQSAQAGWISALVTGDQNAIDQADWDVFRATGVAHLMSISGLHITMFAWLAMGFVGFAWRCSGNLCQRMPAPHAAMLGGLGLAWAYALFSGWGVPSQRTVGMLAVVCVLRVSGRSWPWPVVWLLAGVAVLVVDPWALMQAGFWLSFMAVGVLIASDGPVAAGTSSAGWRHLRALLREQWTITLALTPLVLLLFGQVSLVGFVANLFAIPWVTLLVTPLAMLGVIVPAAWDLAALAVAALAAGLEWLAQWPFATLSVPAAPAGIGVAGVLGGLLIALQLPGALRLAGAALIVPVLLWQEPRPTFGQFDLLAADVGQGNAVLVRTAHHAMLYDAGPRYSRDSDAGHRVLLPLLRALGVQLDLLVLSHRDTDHIGGAESVLAMHPGAGLLAGIEPGHGVWKLRAGRRCEAGQTWQWDGVAFTVVHPLAADYLAPTQPNALSCVVRIEAAARPGQTRQAVVLAGDIESAQERRLVSDRANLNAALLLVPHHGSKTSSSAEFLDAVAPRLAIVQAGYRNRFGHPSALPMARYAERGILVRDSAHCGAMAWRSEDADVLSCLRLERRRYWHHGAAAETRF